MRNRKVGIALALGIGQTMLLGGGVGGWRLLGQLIGSVVFWLLVVFVIATGVKYTKKAVPS